MRRLLILALGVAVAVGALAGSVQTQEKFIGPFDPDASKGAAPGVSYQPAKPADFKHGARLQLTLKNDTKVTGTLVRLDRKNQSYVLRTAPGTAPVAYPHNEVKNVERIVIREAVDAGSQPEIVRQVIINGNRRTVSYYSEVVSPGEREALEQMAKAENELIALEEREDLREAAVNAERAMQAELLQTQREINFALQLVNRIQPVYLVENHQEYPIVLHNPHRETIVHFRGLSPREINWSEGPPAVSSEALSKAREAVRVSSNRAIYEDGRLIAVVYNETTTTKELNKKK
jgi:hypothetical protein